MLPAEALEKYMERGIIEVARWPICADELSTMRISF